VRRSSSPCLVASSQPQRAAETHTPAAGHPLLHFQKPHTLMCRGTKPQLLHLRLPEFTVMINVVSHIMSHAAQHHSTTAKGARSEREPVRQHSERKKERKGALRSTRKGKSSFLCFTSNCTAHMHKSKAKKKAVHQPYIMRRGMPEWRAEARY
jgi:hypothetical protein